MKYLKLTKSDKTGEEIKFYNLSLVKIISYYDYSVEIIFDKPDCDVDTKENGYAYCDISELEIVEEEEVIAYLMKIKEDDAKNVGDLAEDTPGGGI